MCISYTILFSSYMHVPFALPTLGASIFSCTHSHFVQLSLHLQYSTKIHVDGQIHLSLFQKKCGFQEM